MGSQQVGIYAGHKLLKWLALDAPLATHPPNPQQLFIHIKHLTWIS